MKVYVVVSTVSYEGIEDFWIFSSFYKAESYILNQGCVKEGMFKKIEHRNCWKNDYNDGFYITEVTLDAAE